MGLTYRGISLSPWSADTADWIENNVNVRDFYQLWSRLYAPTADLSFLAFPGVLPDGPGGGRMKLGKLWWPRGASRFASIHLLVDDVQLLALRGGSLSNALGAPYPFVMSWEDAAAGGVTVASVTTDLMALPPLPLERIGGANGLNLLTLVDDRWNWWLRAENLLQISEGSTTWEDLYEMLAVDLGVTLDVDAVPAAYLFPSTQWVTAYEYIPLILDAIAYNVGQRIVRQLDGTVRARNFANSLADIATNLALTSARSLVAGGLVAANDISKITAATFDAAFPEVLFGTVSPTPYVVSAATGGTGTGTKSVHVQAIYDGTNAAELAALVAQMAADYAAQFQGGGTWKYAGIVPWAPEAIDDGIEWTLTLLGGQQGDGEISTRIYPPSWNDLVDQLWTASSAGSVVPRPPCDCPPPVSVVPCSGGSGGSVMGSTSPGFGPGGGMLSFDPCAGCLTILLDCTVYQLCGFTVLTTVGSCGGSFSGPSGTQPSGGSPCVPGVCNLCTNPPAYWFLSLVNVPAACPLVHDSLVLNPQANCSWRGGKIAGPLFTQAIWQIGNPVSTLTIFNTVSPGATSGRYTASYTATNVPPNCCQTVVVRLAFSTYPCEMPRALVLTPFCCTFSGGSTGSSGGSAGSNAGVPTLCCPAPNELSSVLFITFSAGTGSCTCLNGTTATLIWNGLAWIGTYTGCDGFTYSLNVQCIFQIGVGQELALTAGGFNNSFSASYNCASMNITAWNVTANGTFCTGGGLWSLTM